MFKEIEFKKFLNKNLEQKLIVIYGPTASWKTAISIDIAKRLNTEIISSDSRQIFRYMDIWTAKITKDEMDWIPHHMIDIVNPDEHYSVWEFKNKSDKIILNLWKSWKIPIICGWTGLYIDSLIYDFFIPKVPPNKELREKLENEAKKYWNQYVYEKLKKIDPCYAKNLHPNNLSYVIRAIEVKTMTGIEKTKFIKEKKLKYDTFFINPFSWTREELYERINKRVHIMIESWLVNEVQNLLKMWYKKTDFWLKTIWYKEIISYLEKNISLDEAIKQIQQNTRNYAKRQYTWFKKYEK